MRRRCHLSPGKEQGASRVATDVQTWGVSAAWACRCRRAGPSGTGMVEERPEAELTDQPLPTISVMPGAGAAQDVARLTGPRVDRPPVAGGALVEQRGARGIPVARMRNEQEGGCLREGAESYVNAATPGSTPRVRARARPAGSGPPRRAEADLRLSMAAPASRGPLWRLELLRVGAVCRSRAHSAAVGVPSA